jgi:hypothetical protein
MATLPYIRPANSRIYQENPAPYYYGIDGALYRGNPVSESTPVTPEQIRLARLNQEQALSAYGKPNNGIIVTNLRNGWQGNLNPELQGGVSLVKYNGQDWRIPNSVIQQLQYTDAWNGGRTNVMADFFGANEQAPRGMKYADYGAAQDRISNWWSRNPQFLQEGALNPFQRAAQKSQDAQAGLRALQAQPRTETRAIQGGIVGEDPEEKLRKAREEARQASEEVRAANTRGANYLGDLRATALNNRAMKELRGAVRPTYSNVPIKETYNRF